MLKSQSAIVPKEQEGERFDLAAVQLFSDISRKKIKLIIDSGGAYVNKKRIQLAKHALKQNDKIEIFWEEKTKTQNENSITAANEFEEGAKNSLCKNSQQHTSDTPTNHKPINGENIVVNKKTSFQSFISNKNIIFENKNFFVINKPAGIASQATLTSSIDTIFHMLVTLEPKKFRLNEMFLVHRLDKDTSGIMLIARNKNTQKKLEDLFREKKIAKTYEALCFQTPQKSSGLISFPIAKDNSRKNCYFAVTNLNSKIRDAKEAQTEYKTLQNFKQEASYIQCFPKTGRTHQIRVHLAAIGCSIIGDKTYSQNVYGHRFAQLALRHMLHATTIHFELEGESFTFSAPYPEDFKLVLKKLESF